MNSFSRISPTARFTGAVWRSLGLSPAALHPRSERWLAVLLQHAAPWRRQLLLEDMLHARHCAIDALLTRAIARGEVSQVVELAAGHSARGWRFKQRFGDALHYVETDLPRMARSKHATLECAGLLLPGHEVRAVDATVNHGEHSLNALLARLDPCRGTALISEGLLNYLPAASVAALWRRASDGLQRFPVARYYADVYLGEDNDDFLTRAFLAALGKLVRGGVALHFADAETLHRQAMRGGWRRVRLWRSDELGLDPVVACTPGARRVRVLEACLATGESA